MLAKAPKTTPKSTFGLEYVKKSAPLDIVVSFNPANQRPMGLVKLVQLLSKRFTVATKVHVHSTATGQKCDLFSPSANTGSRQDAQVIVTVIYSCAVDDLTAYVGNSRLTGISTVSRFIGRLLDIYQSGVREKRAFCFPLKWYGNDSKLLRMSKRRSFSIWPIRLATLTPPKKRKWPWPSN